MSSFSATIFCCLNIIYGDKLNLLLKPVRNNDALLEMDTFTKDVFLN